MTAGEQSIDMPTELVDALHKYLVACLPGATQPERERQYLVHLCVILNFTNGSSGMWRSPAAIAPRPS